ncbi:MAG: OmpA family protein [Saprospiraceae bacterium]
MTQLSPLMLCALLFSTSLLSAQVQKGFKFLDKMEYENAHAAFQKDIENPDKNIAAGYGILKAAAGLTESGTWISAMKGYEKTLNGFNALDANAQKKLGSQYKITQNAIEQAYTSLFSKTLVFVERTKDAEAVRDAFVDAVTVVPKQFGPRFNKLMIQQKTPPPSPAREKMDASKKSNKKPVAVDREPPLGSKLEFVKGINTAGSEYVPVLSSDGKIMYFCGSDRDDNYAKEDIYYTERNPDGSWSEPKMEEFFSGPTDEAVVSMSADGNNLVLFIGGKPHISSRTATGWSEPAPIVLQKKYEWIGMASITRNGEALIFEAKEDTPGDIDIYIALRNKNQSWGMPFKIGPPVNTRLNERTPFLHSDFKTLYFSSNGHPGQGNFDVFKTTRLDDTWKNWSPPENLGTGVNTPKDEYGFCIPPSGNVAYLATRVTGFSDQDILRIPLDSAAQPEAQVIITGTLTDGSGKTMSGEITVEDAESKKVLQTVTTSPAGAYVFSVSKTSKINYYATGDNLVTTKKTYVDASTYKSEVAEEKVEIVTVDEAVSGGKALELRDLLFDFAKSALRPESQAELRRIYADIKSFDWTIEIGGHTDNVGTDQSNLLLSTRRAQAVRDFLVEQGYPAAKITFKGYGPSVPLKGNDTEEGRARNRRVEIKVKSK